MSRTLPQEHRRAQILDAAAAQFAQHGYHRTTIRGIARAAGIADGTVYVHFRSKEELLLSLLDRLNQTPQRPEAFRQLEQADFPRVLEAMVRARLAALWTQRELLRAVLPELLVDPALRERYQASILRPTYQVAEQAFHALRQQGKIRAVDVPSAVRVLAASVFGLLVTHLLGDDLSDDERDTLASTVVTVFLHGLTPDA